jgi:hypothetical protein
MDDVKWRKASHSSANGENCVELARVAHVVAARDSKAPDSGTLAFTVNAWRDLFHQVRAGKYDLH